MIETPISFLQIDSPGAEALLSPGRHAVQGWLMPKLGGGFCDLRVRVGSQVFPGLLGFLRTDLALHFQTGRAHEAAGFQVNVLLEAGPQRLEFEALQIEGVWQEIGGLDVVVDPARPAVDFPVPSAPVRGREFGHLLHSLLTACAPSGDLAERAHNLVAISPFPRDLMRPKAPFHGSLIQPEAITQAPDGLIAISGHLVHTAARIRRVFASVDLHAMQPLQYGEASPAAAANHPRSAAARSCGFSGHLFVPTQLPNPLSLRLYAELADGSHHLVHVARVRRRSGTDLSQPFVPGLTERFDEAVSALRRALAQHQLALVTDAQFEDNIEDVRRSLDGPPPHPIPPAMVEIESTFTHTEGNRREAWGLPRDGLIVAGLVSTAHSAYVHAIIQAAHILRQRHPALAECVLVLTCALPGGLAQTGVTQPLRPLTEGDALDLADLTIRPAKTGEEGLVAGDTVALAEALAHGLYRHRHRLLSGTKAGP